MLGIRLARDAEERLERHARETGRPKSVIARDWIMDRLDREEVDELMRMASRLDVADQDTSKTRAAIRSSAIHLQLLDEEDGGYDWGPDGPPQSS